MYICSMCLLEHTLICSSEPEVVITSVEENVQVSIHFIDCYT